MCASVCHTRRLIYDFFFRHLISFFLRKHGRISKAALEILSSNLPKLCPRVQVSTEYY